MRLLNQVGRCGIHVKSPVASAGISSVFTMDVPPALEGGVSLACCLQLGECGIVVSYNMPMLMATATPNFSLPFI